MAAAAIAVLPSSAQTDPIVSVDAVIDDDGDTLPDNTGTSVGAVDGCVSMTAGASLDVDVVIQDVADLAGFQTDLLYDPRVLKVTAVDYNFLLASTGSSVLDLGEDITSEGDTDGDFFMSGAMFDLLGTTGANGDGVLARVTLEAVGPGTSPLDLSGIKLSDTAGLPIPPVDSDNFYVGPINDASVVVDDSCDRDGDGVPDGSDNCPDWPNSTQALPPWTVPPDDPDCDAWPTNDETFIGTDPGDACGSDAWPADINGDFAVNIFDLNFLGPPVLFSQWPDPPYELRYDLDPDNVINVFDLNTLAPPVFFGTCTP